MNSLFNTAFGQKVKELRKKKGWTQQQLANELGVSKQTVNNYELGKHGALHDILMKLTVIFGVSIDYLVNRDSAPKFLLGPKLDPLPPNSKERAEIILTEVRNIFGWKSFVSTVPEMYEAYLKGKVSDEEFYNATYHQFSTMYKLAHSHMSGLSS